MPRGKYVNHKGRSRHFTSPEELAQQEIDSSEEETSDEEQGATGGKSAPKRRTKKKTEDSSEEDSDEEGEDLNAKKGVAGLIEIENPNRVIKKATIKVGNIDGEASEPEALPSDIKEIARIAARKRHEKRHAEGKTNQAKADLARLAIIRQQRAEAAAKREAEKKPADDRKSTAES